jgi:hypothetical protein
MPLTMGVESRVRVRVLATAPSRWKTVATADVMVCAVRTGEAACGCCVPALSRSPTAIKLTLLAQQRERGMSGSREGR